GELEKARETYEMWAAAYPHDYVPPGQVGVIDAALGNYDKAAAEIGESMRLYPDNVYDYENLMAINIALNRLDEAKTNYQQSLARKFELAGLHGNRYALAFLENDAAEMERQVSWAAGKAGAEDVFLSMQSD